MDAGSTHRPTGIQVGRGSQEVPPVARPEGRQLWETLLAVATGAAGFGLFLVAMGAAVVWIRLEAAGVPADEGLAVVPKASLAVIGGREVAVLLLFNLAAFVAASYYRDHVDQQRALAKELGTSAPGPFWERPAQWSKAIGKGAWSRRVVRWPLLAVLGVLIVVTFPVMLLNRVLGSLWPLTIILWLPFTASCVVLVAGTLAAYRWTEHVWKTAGGRLSVRAIRTRVAMAWLLSAAVLTLVGQAEDAPRLPPVTVQTVDGQSIRGLFVAEATSSVVLGGDDELVAIPRSRVEQVTIGRVKEDNDSSPSLIDRLVGAVF